MSGERPLRIIVGMELRPISPQPPRLLDRVRQALRVRHRSPRTESAYLLWIRRFILFHGKRHPEELGEREVSQFLSHLAIDRNVSPPTQNQALCAILFLYREVLGRELQWVGDVVRATAPKRLPVVLTRREVRFVLERLDGVPRLMATLLYGAGLRLFECCRLRVKDIEFERREIVVRSGKGDRDRVTMLPASATSPLERHLEQRRKRHLAELAAGAGRASLPNAISKKYPNASREWAWQ